MQTDGRNRASSDHSLWGFKRLLKSDPDAARQWADSMIKNTYMTLLTRGQKGCYIWCTDPETNEYFKSLLVAYEAEETQSFLSGAM